MTDLTGADVFDAPDTSLSPTDPAELVAWLRALPVGTVLIGRDGTAFQIHPFGRRTAVIPAWPGGGLYHRESDRHMRDLAAHGPFRLIWSSGGGR